MTEERKNMERARMYRKRQRTENSPEDQERIMKERGALDRKRKLWGPESCSPPGYEYWRRERNGAAFLLGIGAAFSLRFFGRLYQMVKSLYLYVGRERVLREDAREMLLPFGRLVQGHWGLYVPFFLFLAAVAVFHYLYYCRETKSIYLMRRLPAALAASCLLGPLSGMAAGAAAFGLLQLLYYGIYLLSVPKVCFY